MFVRIRKQQVKDHSFSYAYLVENRWNAIRKKHEQKIVASLGRLDTLPVDGTIEKMIGALDRFAASMGIASLSNGIILSDLSDERVLSEVKEWGSLLLTRAIMQQLSLVGILEGAYGKAEKKRTKRIALERFLLASEAILARRFSPRSDASELSTFHWYETDVFLPDKANLPLTSFYRTLDVLIDQKDAIERDYYEKNRDLFNGKLDLVLFDTTSVYYWGAEGSSNEKDLLQYGFSKDGKGNLKQLIVGVLMTSDGVPIAHEVFPGNIADVTAFSRIMTIIKEKYRLEKVILIADRGMVSEDNIVHLEQSGFGYVVGIRMRQLPQPLKRKLLTPVEEDDERFGSRLEGNEWKGREIDWMDKAADNLYTREFPVSRFTEQDITELFIKKIIKGKTATFDEQTIREHVKKRRFFVCLNPYVKAKNKKDREFFTRIIQKKIKTTPIKDFIIKNGYKKYLKFEKGLSPSIDYDRLKDEEIYDGKWIIMTNEKGISSHTAGIYYKTLQTIERGFRDLKSLITVQPIFHWKEQRIRAHIFTCFLALILKWYICRVINPASQEEGRRFIEEMIDLKAIAVDASIPLYVRTELSKEMQAAMGKLKIVIPPKVIADGRRKANPPISAKGGRPRKDRSLNQISFLDSV